jgi:hypothetical protein
MSPISLVTKQRKQREQLNEIYNTEPTKAHEPSELSVKVRKHVNFRNGVAYGEV